MPCPIKLKGDKTMADRLKWTYIDGTLQVGFNGEILDTYKVVDIYPEIATYTETQREIILYGVKQNLSDKIAGMKDDTREEKIKVMSSRFKDLVEGRWKTPAKEKTSLKKRAKALVDGKTLNPVELALLKRLGLTS